MTRKLAHRGPDDQGTWIDPNGHTALTQTRLSIIDLSTTGHQPMASHDGRFTIVFNGEIYNYRELRRELEQSHVRFRGHSDTEVLLELFAREGTACMSCVIGMFAFAIWDRIEKTLFLARDPLGIKTLYYWKAGHRIAFASEIRAVLESDLGPRDLDPDSLYGYFLHGSVQEPATLARDVRIVPPGHVLRWNSDQLALDPYWQLGFTDQVSDPMRAVSTVSAALEHAMERHFVSDVPVGIFLSGGLDSTALLALSRRIGHQGVRTFSIGFEDAHYDESGIAERTAEHFGAEHHQQRLTSQAAIGMLEDFAASIDQPSIDGFNTYVVSRFASQHGMKVVLSGLGGDELFGSYPSFEIVPRLLAWHARCERLGLKPLAQIASRWIGGYQASSKVLRFLASDGGLTNAFQAVRSVFHPNDASTLVRWHTSEPNWECAETPLDKTMSRMGLRNAISNCEISHYMRNQLLRDADVMSMSQSLELRVPFLDRSLVEELSRIAPELRLKRGKQLLLDAVPEIPSWVRNREKRGFAFPFAHWLERHWQGEFSRIQRQSPVPLPKWYHRWSLFALHSFLDANRIARPAANPMRSAGSVAH